MLAILSDIHGNLEALRAVLDDIETMNVDSVICLGDLVGYGPDPCACIELAMQWDIVLRGNFDDAVVHAERCENWIEFLSKMMVRLRQCITQHEKGEAMMGFLAELPTSHVDEDTLFVHGSPRDHVHEYVFPEDIYDTKKLSAIFDGFEKICFCGHTHVPGVFSASDSAEWVFCSPPQCDYVYSVGEKQVLCNVGSVGQPRGGDPRACYVLFDGNKIVFRRIDYDYETTMRKIRSGDDDDLQGDRLPFGR